MKHKIRLDDPSAPAREIVAVQHATPADLKELWRSLYGGETPSRIIWRSSTSGSTIGRTPIYSIDHSKMLSSPRWRRPQPEPKPVQMKLPLRSRMEWREKTMQDRQFSSNYRRRTDRRTRKQSP